MQLRYLVENGMVLTLDKYPIFDESYRLALNTKIINHYYFNEIGLETPMLFNFQLGVKMNESMAYYNQLYKSELLKINPLYNFQMDETFNKNGETVGNTKNANIIDNTNSNSSNNNDNNIMTLLEITTGKKGSWTDYLG